MTIRDVSADFGFVPQTASSAQVVSTSIVGGPNTYLGINSFDSGPFAAYLTEFSPMDTILTVGGQNFFVEAGAGGNMKLVIDWTTAPLGGTSVRTQLITAATSNMSTPTVMIDFGIIPIASVPVGTRQIMALPRSNAWARYLAVQVVTAGTMSAGAFVSWLGLDVDSIVQGYASGFPIK
jgi:hypothetical protein